MDSYVHDLKWRRRRASCRLRVYAWRVELNAVRSGFWSGIVGHGGVGSYLRAVGDASFFSRLDGAHASTAPPRCARSRRWGARACVETEAGCLPCKPAFFKIDLNVFIHLCSIFSWQILHHALFYIQMYFKKIVEHKWMHVLLCSRPDTQSVNRTATRGRKNNIGEERHSRWLLLILFFLNSSPLSASSFIMLDLIKPANCIVEILYKALNSFLHHDLMLQSLWCARLGHQEAVQ